MSFLDKHISSANINYHLPIRNYEFVLGRRMA